MEHPITIEIKRQERMAGAATKAFVVRIANGGVIGKLHGIPMTPCRRRAKSQVVLSAAVVSVPENAVKAALFHGEALEVVERMVAGV